MREKKRAEVVSKAAVGYAAPRVRPAPIAPKRPSAAVNSAAARAREMEEMRRKEEAAARAAREEAVAARAAREEAAARVREDAARAAREEAAEKERQRHAAAEAERERKKEAERQQREAQKQREKAKLEALALERAQREKRDRELRAAELEAERAVAASAPPSKPLPSMVSGGKPPSRAVSSNSDVADGGVASSRPGGPVVRDVFALQRGASQAVLPRNRSHQSVSGGDLEDVRRSNRSSSPQPRFSDAGPPLLEPPASARGGDAFDDHRFDHMSARDRVLARKREEQSRKDEQRKRELAQAAQAAVAGRMFAQQREAEQYRGTGAAKVSGIVIPGRVSDAGAGNGMKLPASKYTLDDSLVDGDDDEYSEAVQYSLAGGGGGGAVQSSKHRTPRRGPTGFVLPGADPEYLEAGRMVQQKPREEVAAPAPAPADLHGADYDDDDEEEDLSEIDTDDSDIPVDCEDPAKARALRRKAAAPPDDDDEIDAVEEQLQQELGVFCPLEPVDGCCVRLTLLDMLLLLQRGPHCGVVT